MSGAGRGYIAGPVYDWVFFLLPPLLSLAAGIAIAGTRFSDHVFLLDNTEVTGAGLAIGALIHAHLVAVLVRSHGNRDIRQRHPIRFFAVPIALWLAIVSSPWIAVTATVVATFWDVWHSGAQTFGFARIYDRNRGNPPHQGRRLDFWLSQLLYAGPILGGVTLVDHVESVDGFADLGATFFRAVPVQVQGSQRYLAWAVLAAGTVFLLVYAARYLHLYRRGYRVSLRKIFLMVTTGACSIYTWGFNTWGEAFFIMNLFHGVQYLALVWAMEHGRMQALLRLPGRGGKAVTCAVYLGAVFAYGVAVELLDASRTSLWAATIVVSLLHFWYDGFIWSVARRQV